MTSEIRKEVVNDIKDFCKKFGINTVINEEKRYEILAEQYEKLKFPLVFYDLHIEDAGSPIPFEDNKYCYDEEIQVLLTMENREKLYDFDMLYMFLANTNATNDYFDERKHKKKIRKVYKIQETPFNFMGRRYYKQVLQFSYFAEHYINKDFREE